MHFVREYWDIWLCHSSALGESCLGNSVQFFSFVWCTVGAEMTHCSFKYSIRSPCLQRLNLSVPSCLFYEFIIVLFVVTTSMAAAVLPLRLRINLIHIPLSISLITMTEMFGLRTAHWEMFCSCCRILCFKVNVKSKRTCLLSQFWLHFFALFISPKKCVVVYQI